MTRLTVKMNIKEKNREKIWLSKQDTSPEALESQDLIARKLRVGIAADIK